MIDGISDSIQRSREVDRQSPTGLIFIHMTIPNERTRLSIQRMASRFRNYCFFDTYSVVSKSSTFEGLTRSLYLLINSA